MTVASDVLRESSPEVSIDAENLVDGVMVKVGRLCIKRENRYVKNPVVASYFPLN